VSVILVKNWWSLVIRGFAAILLGLITVVWPGIRSGSFALVFFAYALVDGLVGIAGAVRAAEQRERWGPLFIEGLAGVGAAMITIAWPAITDLTLMYVIAAWALVTGVLEIVTALQLREYIPGEWLLALSGVASLILGMLLIAIPLAGPLPIAFWVGAYAFVFGALLVGLAFRLRSWARTPARDSHDGSVDWQRG
jgi:uncharacterized membrane protein HdeD (DUF308 family)